jgi:hypothetical protein
MLKIEFYLFAKFHAEIRNVRKLNLKKIEQKLKKWFVYLKKRGAICIDLNVSLIIITMMMKIKIIVLF